MIFKQVTIKDFFSKSFKKWLIDNNLLIERVFNKTTKEKRLIGCHIDNGKYFVVYNNETINVNPDYLLNVWIDKELIN